MRHRPKEPLKLFEIRPPITYSRMQETSLYASKTAITARFVASSSFLTTSDRPTVQTSVQAARKQSSKTPLATLSAGLISRVRWSFRWSFLRQFLRHLSGGMGRNPSVFGRFERIHGGGMTTTRHSIHIYNTRMYNGLPLLRSVGCPGKCVCGIRKRSFMRF